MVRYGLVLGIAGAALVACAGETTPGQGLGAAKSNGSSDASLNESSPDASFGDGSSPFSSASSSGGSSSGAWYADASFPDASSPVVSSWDASSGAAPLNHRPVAVSCSEPAPPGDCPQPYNGPNAFCNTDADCADTGDDGRCVFSGIGPATCICTHDACSSDSQCGTGQDCACRGTPYAGASGNQCIASNCHVDSDCGTGGYCSPSDIPNGIGLSGYYCHTANDECMSDSDCVTDMGNEAFCVYEPSAARWQCWATPVPL